jgi:hypothetical protein
MTSSDLKERAVKQTSPAVTESPAPQAQRGQKTPAGMRTAVPRKLKWGMVASILINVVLLVLLAVGKREQEPAPAPPAPELPTYTKQDIEKSRSVTAGMTMTGVKDLLGEPVVREIAGDREEWHYCRTGKTVDEYVAIAFASQKVSSLQYYTVRSLDLAFHYAAQPTEKIIDASGTGDCRLTVRWGTYAQKTPSFPENPAARLRSAVPAASASGGK